MDRVRECSECGRPFITNVHTKLTCSKTCSETRRLKKVEEKNARARAATLERVGVKICLTCGKEFTANHPAKVCCSPECQKVRERKLVNDAYRSSKQKRKEKKIKGNEKAINDINTKARAMGLSYGQYVARYGG